MEYSVTFVVWVTVRCYSLDIEPSRIVEHYKCVIFEEVNQSRFAEVEQNDIVVISTHVSYNVFYAMFNKVN